MPSADPEDYGDDVPSDATKWQRFSASIKHMMLKPAVEAESRTGNAPANAGIPDTIPELEVAVKRANDKERLIGLLAAPVAAAIGFLVTTALVKNDPAARLANGQLNSHHVNPSLYTELGLVTMALALVMLGAAWFRKRVIIGFAAALYGLSLFNLHYWGFGVPYILIGSWYLVRAYRLQDKLKRMKAEGATGYLPTAAPPPPSKRYTPPTPQRRAPKPKPGKGIEAG